MTGKKIIQIISVLFALAVKIDDADTVSYTYGGISTGYWGDYEVAWHCFTNAGAADDDPYKYIILTAVHQDSEESMLHYHLRYGSTEFEDLVTNTDYSYWWPTFVASSLTVEEAAENYAASADEFAAMIPAILNAQNQTPVPGTILLLGPGLIALAGIRRRS